MRVPLYITNCFSLAAFKILFFTFDILIIMCLGVGLFGFILFEMFRASWTCMSASFNRLGKFSTIISSNSFSVIFSLASPSGSSIMQMFSTLNVVPQVP